MNSVKTLDPKEISVAEVHGLLLAAVAPRPIAFASTVNADGAVNLSPFSFFNVFSANPPIMIFSPARRGRDNTTKHTYENIKKHPEVVINIVNYPIVEQMSLASTEYEEGVNEFIKSGLTEVPSERVSPPRVGEAPVSFECTVDKVIELGDQGGAGNLIIAKVELIHMHTKYLNHAGKLDTTKLDLVARMGESWYCRASEDALFEIPKPILTRGLGVDQLHESIRNSKVLTGNNLGRLGNLEKLPTDIEVAAVGTEHNISDFLKKYQNQPEEKEEALHKLAQQFLNVGYTQKAMAILMTPLD